MKHEDLMELASRGLSVYDPETGHGRAARMMAKMPYSLVVRSMPRLVAYHSKEAEEDVKADIESVQAWLKGLEADKGEYREYVEAEKLLEKKEAQLERILFARWKVENSTPLKADASGDQDGAEAHEGDAQ